MPGRALASSGEEHKIPTTGFQITSTPGAQDLLREHVSPTELFAAGMNVGRADQAYEDGLRDGATRGIGPPHETQQNDLCGPSSFPANAPGKSPTLPGSSNGKSGTAKKQTTCVRMSFLVTLLGVAAILWWFAVLWIAGYSVFAVPCGGNFHVDCGNEQVIVAENTHHVDNTVKVHTTENHYHGSPDLRHGKRVDTGRCCCAPGSRNDLIPHCCCTKSATSPDEAKPRRSPRDNSCCYGMNFWPDCTTEDSVRRTPQKAPEKKNLLQKCGFFGIVCYPFYACCTIFCCISAWGMAGIKEPPRPMVEGPFFKDNIVEGPFFKTHRGRPIMEKDNMRAEVFILCQLPFILTVLLPTCEFCFPDEWKPRKEPDIEPVVIDGRTYGFFAGSGCSSQDGWAEVKEVDKCRLALNELEKSHARVAYGDIELYGCRTDDRGRFPFFFPEQHGSFRSPRYGHICIHQGL